MVLAVGLDQSVRGSPNFIIESATCRVLWAIKDDWRRDQLWLNICHKEVLFLDEASLVGYNEDLVGHLVYILNILCIDIWAKTEELVGTHLLHRISVTVETSIVLPTTHLRIGGLRLVRHAVLLLQLKEVGTYFAA